MNFIKDFNFWRKTSPSTPPTTTAPTTMIHTSPKSEPIDKTFRRAAVLGHCLGLFPCSSVLLRENISRPRYLFIPTFVSIILYISSVTGSFFGLLLYLQQFGTVENVSLSKTDIFALKMFLSALLTSRSFAPLFCLRKAKSIAILVQSVAGYDKTFQIKISHRFLNFTLFVLVLGSISNAVTNAWVSLPVMYKAYKNDQFPTLFRIFGLKSPVLEYLHTFSGGFYGEIGLLFATSTTLFLGRAITKRVEDIQKGLSTTQQHLLQDGGGEGDAQQQQQVLLSGKTLATSIKKMKALFGIKQTFDEIFGSFLVSYVTFSILILVTTLYCLISFTIRFHAAENSLRPEFISVLSVVLLTCVRLMVFVECGEKMLTSGNLLSTKIAFIDPSKCDCLQSLAYIHRINDKINFAFSAKGYFIVKRRLVPTLIGSVLTFTVVLAQFDDSDRIDSNCNTTTFTTNFNANTSNFT